MCTAISKISCANSLRPGAVLARSLLPLPQRSPTPLVQLLLTFSPAKSQTTQFPLLWETTFECKWEKKGYNIFNLGARLALFNTISHYNIMCRRDIYFDCVSSCDHNMYLCTNYFLLTHVQYHILPSTDGVGTLQRVWHSVTAIPEE